MTSKKGILIIGADFQGLQAALTLARLGRHVTLIDKNIDIAAPSANWSNKGKRWNQYLYSQVRYHPLIELLTQTEIAQIKEVGGGVQVDTIQGPMWVSPDLCVDCGTCLVSCPVELSTGRKPLFELSVPSAMAIDKREKAPCRTVCPIGMNPQGYIALIARNRFEEAYELIQQTNPLPAICGRVCHHPCETACRRQEIDEPVAICALKRFATDQVEKTQVEKTQAGKKKNKSGIGDTSFPEGKRVAVIGSGPAGLTAAYDLAKAGLRPTLIEAEGRPGGLLWHGIAPYRLPREIIKKEIAQILDSGVGLRLNSPVNSYKDLKKLKSEGFRTILLATGASKDLWMKIRGENLKGIYGCVSFLKNLWKGKSFKSPGSVVVIGGGNAAIEAARTSIRLGAQSVTIIYRRTIKEMPADPHEIEQAIEEGVKLRPLTNPIEFSGKGDVLKQVKCIKMKLGDADASGRPRPIPVDGSDFFINADAAIVSIGQQADISYGVEGNLKLNRRGTIEVEEGGLTSISGVYASGDAVSGPSTVVEAMASGRKAARTIINTLNPDTIPDGREDSDFSGREYDPILKDIPPKKRSSPFHRKISERIKDKNEVIGPFAIKDAVKEASRCLQCGVCSECLRCEAACNLDAINHGRTEKQKTLYFNRVILSDKNHAAPKIDFPWTIQVEHFGKKDSWTKAVMAGRAAAVKALEGTTPVASEPAASDPAASQQASRKRLDSGELKIGIFICSCNGTLNANDRLDEMIAPLTDIPAVAHAQVIVSACHPEKGRRIEEVISQKSLNGVLIASCTCCHLAFACESCTDQRIRLKHRLFREAGYEPKDFALVNIKETCLLSYKNDDKAAIDQSMRVIRSGIGQLKDSNNLPLESKKSCPQAIVLGATEAGIFAARGLKENYASVVVVENLKVEKRIREELSKYGIDLVQRVKPIRLDGRRGKFTLLLEKEDFLLSEKEKKSPKLSLQKKGKRLLNLDIKAFDENLRYKRIQAGIIILARNEFKNILYKRDSFATGFHAGGNRAFGGLETSVPGVYMASWSQVKNISDQTSGMSAAGEALENSYGQADAFDSFVAYADPELCRGCGKCADICPEGAACLEEISRGVGTSWIEPKFCTGCGNCVLKCPTGAISLPESGQEYFEKVINAFLG
jgi:NADPH-dependent glutamate synthase beta subunit-like oxidoreductase/Pyruvate/2-oxoacid:ferredoxin oxidoreductase delta subunit